MATVATEQRRAVVIEDDADIAALVEFALVSQGFDVTIVGDGLTGVDTVRDLDPDLITLDVGLPGIDGVEACRRIRTITDAYIIMVTALSDEIDRLIGLETGADDYLAKPFSVRELKARVNAMFRRPRRGPGSPLATEPPETAPVVAEVASHPVVVSERLPEGHEVLRHGTLTLDVDGHRALRDDEELALTPTEFGLLATLMRSPARVWSREALLREVWGDVWTSETHLVEVHMGNLRRKLGEARGKSRFVRTVRGVGYRMETAD
ncbi:winged helix-turn-helix domain-containing protein [Nocardioides pacificus]